MSFRDCLLNAKVLGDVPAQEIDDLIKRYDALEREAKGTLGANFTEKAVAERLQKEVSAETLHAKRQIIINAKIADQIKNDLLNFRDSNGNPDIAKAALYKLEHFGEAKYSSVEGTRKAIQGMARAELKDILMEFERKWITGKHINLPTMDDMVRALHGEKVENERATAFAKAFRQTSETLRQRFNAAGGAIGKLENWFPHQHDNVVMVSKGMDEWKATIKPLLDREKMRNPLTGEMFTSQSFDAMLTSVYRRIVSNGTIDMKPSRGFSGGSSYAERHGDHRFLVFKSADDWMNYDSKFGSGNAFASMMSYVDTMARDIAIMEVLGTMPKSTVKWMRQLIVQEGGKAVADVKALLPEKAALNARFSNVNKEAADLLARKDYAKSYEHFIGLVYDDIAGAAHAVVNAGTAKFWGTIRSFGTATRLGGAMLSSLTDVWLQGYTRVFSGISTKRSANLQRALSGIFYRHGQTWHACWRGGAWLYAVERVYITC